MRRASFTLIELLIVIGILSILIVAVFMSLKPAETQKKARDIRRKEDIATLQTIIEQYLNDGGAPVCTSGTGCTSNSAGILQKQPCATSWLPLVTPSLCSYAATVPLDPANSITRKYISGGTVTAPTLCASCTTMYYQFRMDSSGNYEINVRQESLSNATHTFNDAGNAIDWIEVGSNLTLF